MKKIIFATMVAIAMLVGIQPIFAEQFITPEVSTSDSQCFVLDLPAGATAETLDYTAPWQSTTAITSVSGSFILSGGGSYNTIPCYGCSSLVVTAVKDVGYPADCYVELYWDYNYSSAEKPLAIIDLRDTPVGTVKYLSIPNANISSISDDLVAVLVWASGSLNCRTIIGYTGY